MHLDGPQKVDLQQSSKARAYAHAVMNPSAQHCCCLLVIAFSFDGAIMSCQNEAVRWNGGNASQWFAIKASITMAGFVIWDDIRKE